MMDTNNSEANTSGEQWQSQLLPESRQRIINKIMETLERHLPFHGQEGLNDIRRIAVRFEEKNFSTATSQSDYLRRISLTMLKMESLPRTVCIAAKRKRVMAP